MTKAVAKTAAKETYVLATEKIKELTNLKRRNPDGKNVEKLQKQFDKLIDKLPEENRETQKAAIEAWAESLPE